MIFVVEQARQLKFERFWQRQKCYRQWHAVRIIQRFRRKVLAGIYKFQPPCIQSSTVLFTVAEREKRKKVNRVGWFNLKNEYATKIQVCK